MNKRVIPKGLKVILQPPAITQCMLNKKSHICSGTHITKSSVDRYSYIAHDCFVLNADIGPFCSIADNCRIGGATHPMSRVSTSPVFHAGKNVCHKNFSDFPKVDTPKLTIEADVWIGANTIVMSGLTIGVGSIIGAGSVVTHDIPPYEVWAGCPAKKIRDRFDERVKNGLLNTKWWTWEDTIIEKYSSCFSDPLLLIDMYEKEVL